MKRPHLAGRISVGILPIIVTSCATPQSLPEAVENVGDSLGAIRALLKENGYAMWYPASAGIRPGSLWGGAESSPTALYPPPASLRISEPVDAAMLSGYTSAATSLSSNLQAILSLLGKAPTPKELADIQAELSSLSISRIDFSFGQPKIERFTLGQLRDKPIPAAYLSCIKNDTDARLIAEVIHSADLSIKIKIASSSNVKAGAKVLQSFVGLSVSSSDLGGGNFEWAVPGSASLVFGVRYADPALLKTILK